MNKIEYLFQGKLISVALIPNEQSLSLRTMIPKNANDYAVGSASLFDEVTIEVPFEKLTIGSLNVKTLDVTKGDELSILSTFANRVFRGDYGDPQIHGVDDVKIQTLINVHLSQINDSSIINEIELVIPDGIEMPYVKINFSEPFKITDISGNELNYEQLIYDLTIFYEHGFLGFKGREEFEWEVLHGIKNSCDYYKNRLKSYWAYRDQDENSPIKLNKGFGDLLRPLWITVEGITRDNYGNVDNVIITDATSVKRTMKQNQLAGKEMWWLAPDDYATTLMFLSNELINSESNDPFQEILDCYISNWEFADTLGSALPNDLRRVVNATEHLKTHPNKDEFFLKFELFVVERNLVYI